MNLAHRWRAGCSISRKGEQAPLAPMGRRCSWRRTSVDCLQLTSVGDDINAGKMLCQREDMILHARASSQIAEDQHAR